MAFKCPFCLINCGDPKSLIEHLKSHNLVTKPGKESNQPNPREVTLAPCHVRITRCDNLIKCQSTKESSVKPSPNESSVKSSPKESSVMPSPNESSASSSLKVPEKKSVGRRNGNNYIEIKGKGGKLLYGCPMCSKVWHCKSSFQQHFRTHTGEKPFVCKHCNRAFSQLGNLVVHVRRKHTGERPFKCVHCDRSFTTSGELQQHTRFHTGAKPYTCKHCQRTFSHSGNLKVHIRRWHSGEKPYTCEHCRRSFCTSTDLNSHVRVHSGEKLYTCQHCICAFTWHVQLKNHIRRKHTDGKLLKCKFCNYKCTTKRVLKQHCLGFHKLVNWNLSTK